VLEDPLRRVEGLIGEGDYLTTIYGPSTAGKSFLVIDLCFALLLGRKWFGRKTLKCGVLYIALEGRTGFFNRLKAYIRRFLADVALDGLPFDVITAPVDFGPEQNGRSNDHVARAIATVEEMNRQYDTPVGVIVFDNMRAAAPAMHENYSEEVAGFLGKARFIGAASGASPVVVHNTGKDADRGLRGAQAQFDLADTVIEVKGDPRSWVATKVRDGLIAKPAGFVLEQVDLGAIKDVDGEDKSVFSSVVMPDDSPVATKRPPAPSLRAGLDILRFALDQHGTADQPLGPDSTLVRTIEKEPFRKLFYSARGDLENEAARRQAFNRLLTEGRNAGLLNTRVLTDGRVLIWRT
jgi:hypothetical protein